MTVLIPRPKPPEKVHAHDGASELVERADVDPVGSVAYRNLYKKRTPIYPKAVQGVFRRFKWTFMAALLGFYYLAPWLRWDRGEGRVNQAFMVDFEGRRFYFGPIELWPQEVYYIVGVLVVAALGIFLAAALLGRVWCGYACPQTVWTDLFLFVERRIEGDRAAQMRLAKAPMSFDKALKKISKHTIWLIIAAATGGAWVFYFGDAPTLARDIFTGQASLEIYLFIALLTFTTYALAGTMREQVCTYMCPWPRIQAAMIDRHTLQVMYRADRGEPRGPHKKGQSWDNRGDCVDCKACVAVCPQGIDIREGAQLECINCALCIDACDEIMKKVGRPTGLIAYDTDDNLLHRTSGQKPEYRVFRPRTVLYATLMIAIAVTMLYSLTTRQLLQLNVLRDRNPAYVRLADGAIRNGYTAKIINMHDEPRDVILRVEGPPSLILKSEEGVVVSGGALAVTANADAVTTARFYLALPAADAAKTRQTPLRIIVQDAAGKERAERTSTLLSGAPK